MFIYCQQLLFTCLLYITSQHHTNAFINMNFFDNAASSYAPFNRRKLIKYAGLSLVSMSSFRADESIASENPCIVERKGSTVIFYCDVTVESCFALVSALKDAIIESKTIASTYDILPPSIKLRIQSQGGDLLPTISVIDFIQSSDIAIDSYIEGFAASSASLIAVSCKKRYMTKNSLSLLHQLSGTATGKFNDVLQEVNNMDSFMNIIRKTYITKTKIQEEDIDEILRHDIWWNAEKCLELGIIDKIL